MNTLQPPVEPAGMWHLIILGANPAGMSVAYEAQRAGLEKVLVLAEGDRAIPSTAPGRHRLSVRYQTRIVRMENLENALAVESDTETFRTRVCVDARDVDLPGPPPAIPISATASPAVHTSTRGWQPRDSDVLVVGDGERAAARCIELEEAGGRVVFALTGSFDLLSRLTRRTLAALEHQQRITILWASEPVAVDLVGSHPMAFFDDRRTPDLQFDHVVFAASEPVEASSGRIYRVGPGGVISAHAWAEIRDRYSQEFPRLRPTIDTRRVHDVHTMARLREQFYNATITWFDHSHEDLWVIRVRPDSEGVAHVAGQYATLGLGYWEPRVDEATEDLTDRRRASLIRRSYSISSRIFDAHGYLTDAAATDDIEFYIVHVRPSGRRIPALTPRLADKRAGDRIYLGPKIAGRYTLDPVTDPESDVVFLATGTGEAPHNAMITELLRKGHTGTIVSAVTVRHQRDLGYLSSHRRLESRFPNYHYLVLPTREPDQPKRYIQDLIRSGELEAALRFGLSPDRTHVFLCGNPAMIGLPRREGEALHFPEEAGVTQLLVESGFTLDHRGRVGNIHVEEYW